MAKPKPPAATSPQSPAAKKKKLSMKAKNRLQSLFKARGIDKPVVDESIVTQRVVTSAKSAPSGQKLNGAAAAKAVATEQPEIVPVKTAKNEVSLASKPTAKAAADKEPQQSPVGKHAERNRRRKEAKQLRRQQSSCESSFELQNGADGKTDRPAKEEKLTAEQPVAAIGKKSSKSKTPNKSAEHKPAQPKPFVPSASVLKINGHATPTKAIIKTATPKPDKTPKRLAKSSDETVQTTDNGQVQPELTDVVIAPPKAIKSTASPKASKPPKRLAKSPKVKSTISTQDLLNTLKKRLAPGGGFDVETDDEQADESAEEKAKPASKRRITNGFVEEDVTDSLVEKCCNGADHHQEDEEEEVEEEQSCDDSECDCNCSCTTASDCGSGSEISIGSDAEEIGSGDEPMDWSDSFEEDEYEQSSSDDESCPELIPIGAQLPSDSEDSEASSGGWCEVDSNDGEELWTTSGEGSSDSDSDSSNGGIFYANSDESSGSDDGHGLHGLSNDSMFFYDKDNSDGIDSCSDSWQSGGGSEEESEEEESGSSSFMDDTDSYYDSDEEAAFNDSGRFFNADDYEDDDEELPAFDEDPEFFEKAREPMIVTLGRGSSQAAAAACPIAVDEQTEADQLNRTIDANDSIGAIVRSVQKSKKRKLPEGGAEQANVSRVKLAERLEERLDVTAPEVKAAEVVQVIAEIVEAIGEKPKAAEAEETPSPVATDSPTESQSLEDDADQTITNIHADDAPYDPFDATLTEGATTLQGDFDEAYDAGDEDQLACGPKRPVFFNAINAKQVLLVLKAELHFHGILNVRLLAGNVRIHGYQLRLNQTVRAHSPRGAAFLSMTPGKPVNKLDTSLLNVAPDLDEVQKILSAISVGFLNADIYAAIEAFQPAEGDALVLLEAGDRQSAAFNMLDKYMRQAIFPHAGSFNTRRPQYSSEFVLRSQFYVRPRAKLLVNRQWLELDLGKEATSRMVVLGGKGVGKSTYVRWLVNQAVQRHGACLLVDLDIGQPELFVPQCVNATFVKEPLLGAGYMQARRPDKALLFGEINVTLAPLKYLRCVLRLWRECQKVDEWRRMPWVVNTMGYNRGFGMELMAAVLRVADGGVTDVVQIQSQRRLDNYEKVLTAQAVNEFGFNFFRKEVEAAKGWKRQAGHRTHVMRSMARKFGDRAAEWDMSARDVRMATVVAALGGVVGAEGTAWLTDVRPVCAPLDSLSIIVANEKVTSKQQLDLLNGNLVYLCRKPDDDDDSENVDDNVQCLGIGIVRAVDHRKRNVYLLPAVDRERLSAVNCLAICNTPLPTSLITNHSARVQGRIPYAYKTDDFIGSKQVVRISYRPDGTPRKK